MVIRRRAGLVTRAVIAAFGALAISTSPASAQRAPEIAYTVSADPRTPDHVNATIEFRNLPDSFRIAMAVHPEYDNRYWRNIRGLRVTRSRWAPDDRDSTNRTAPDTLAPRIERTDSTLWNVFVRAGSGVIEYTVQINRESNPDSRASWHPFLRNEGALLSSEDFLLYLPDFPGARVRLDLHVPPEWRIATGLAANGGVRRACVSVLAAPPKPDPNTCPGFTRISANSVAELLDSPILLGDLHRWDFTAGAIPHHISYWPLPDAKPFDTLAFARHVEGIAREAHAIFGVSPFSGYTFLFQDGAWGALEHANSVTIGIPSADLAADVNSYLVEIAHEFFHAWNLVALRPAGWGGLSYSPPAPTTGLWFSEGVTMYYAYLLPRRIGFPGQGHTRIEQLEEDLGSYFGNSGNTRISPERASFLADSEPWAVGNDQADYYLVGRLLGEALELIVNDSTRGRHGMDEVMRTMYAAHADSTGFTDTDIEHAVDVVCRCEMGPFFRDHVRGAKPLDFDRYLSSLGLRVSLDTIPDADSAGVPNPDTRVWVRASSIGRRARLIIFNSEGAWAKAGLRSGEELVSINGVQVDSMPDLRRLIRTIKLNDVVPVEVVRGGQTQRVNVKVTGITKVRAKITERPRATRAQVERRRRWLSGRLSEDEI